MQPLLTTAPVGAGRSPSPFRYPLPVPALPPPPARPAPQLTHRTPRRASPPPLSYVPLSPRPVPVQQPRQYLSEALPSPRPPSVPRAPRHVVRPPTLVRPASVVRPGSLTPRASSAGQPSDQWPLPSMSPRHEGPLLSVPPLPGDGVVPADRAALFEAAYQSVRSAERSLQAAERVAPSRQRSPSPPSLPSPPPPRVAWARSTSPAAVGPSQSRSRSPAPGWRRGSVGRTLSPHSARRGSSPRRLQSVSPRWRRHSPQRSSCPAQSCAVPLASAAGMPWHALRAACHRLRSEVPFEESGFRGSLLVLASLDVHGPACSPFYVCCRSLADSPWASSLAKLGGWAGQLPVPGQCLLQRFTGRAVAALWSSQLQRHTTQDAWVTLSSPRDVRAHLSRAYSQQCVLARLPEDAREEVWNKWGLLGACLSDLVAFADLHAVYLDGAGTQCSVMLVERRDDCSSTSSPPSV